MIILTSSLRQFRLDKIEVCCRLQKLVRPMMLQGYCKADRAEVVERDRFATPNSLAGVKLIWPVAGRGRPRKRHIPDILSRAAEDMLANAKWQNVSWRNGTKGRLEARFAALRVRTADGPPQRIKDMGQQHLPGDEAWLIGEHRMSGEKKYYLANLPAKTDLRTLAATIKARWICEQAHQQLKEELGLDHFEGRSWQGLHRHALMTMIAYAFLQYRRLTQAGRKKKNQRSTASAEPAGRTPSHRRSHRSTTTSAMPVLQKTNRRKATA